MGHRWAWASIPSSLLVVVFDRSDASFVHFPWLEGSQKLTHFQWLAVIAQIRVLFTSELFLNTISKIIDNVVKHFVIANSSSPVYFRLKLGESYFFIPQLQKCFLIRLWQNVLKLLHIYLFEYFKQPKRHIRHQMRSLQLFFEYFIWHFLQTTIMEQQMDKLFIIVVKFVIFFFDQFHLLTLQLVIFLRFNFPLCLFI